MNILITGGTGFLGSEILKILPKRDKIFILDLKKKILSRKFKFIKGSILRRDLNKVLKSNNINIVVHLAAALGVKKTENNPKEVLDVNIRGTFNILDSIKNSKVKKIIFASSSEIYGDKYNKKVRENNSSLTNFQLKARGEFYNYLTPILESYAKENSISLILKRENILIGKTNLDISQNILEIFNDKIKTIKVN